LVGGITSGGNRNSASPVKTARETQSPHRLIGLAVGRSCPPPPRLAAIRVVAV